MLLKMLHKKLFDQKVLPKEILNTNVVIIQCRKFNITWNMCVRQELDGRYYDSLYPVNNNRNANKRNG